MKETADYIELLRDFGLEDREAKVYLTCLRLGQATPNLISHESGIQRTYVYNILVDLFEKGLISEVEIRGKKTYSALSIEQFKALQAEKMRRLESLVPELKAFERAVGDRPKVRFYEGKEGIFIAQQETLTLPRGSEILAYATGQGLYQYDPDFALSYIRQRAKKGITARSLAADTPETRQFTDKNKEQLRTTRLVPADQFPFTNEINIWGNKVSIMSMQGQLLAVVIESESIARTQRSIFELAWRGAANFQRESTKRN